MSLSGVVTEQAMSAAKSTAITDLARVWTYEDVATSIERHSAALDRAGVRPGDRVGVHFNKCAEGFIAMHASVSAGAVAVPLDPSSPASRLAQICNDMDISVVLTHQPRTKSIAALHELHPLRSVIGLNAELPSVEVVTPLDVAGLSPRPPVTVDAGSLAYIVTTSGSTGEPKGICHTHESARAYAEMTTQSFELCANDRIADISPHHFDISTFSLWATPLAGASNVIVNEAYQRLPASHSQLLVDEAVTIWYSVPFLIQQLVLRGDLANRNLEALRWVHFGGEVIPPEMIARMMAHCSNARFANIFGPAEVNHCTTAIFDVPPSGTETLSIGRPVANTEVRITPPLLDAPTGSPEVPDGEVGEMWVATPQLMAGYWDRDETNAAVIKTVDGTRFYRTGDLVSRNSSGELAFHGRVDHQIKVRGFRLEIEGIEADLESVVHADQTAESVVLSVMRSPSGEDELIAGVLGATTDFSSDCFLAGAAAVLPAYAVPNRTVILEQSAFTGSGKLDRRVLRESAVEQSKDNQ